MVHFLVLGFSSVIGLVSPQSSGIDPQKIEREAAAFLSYARTGKRQEGKLRPWSSKVKILPEEFTDSLGRSYVTVEHSIGRVYFDKERGNLVGAILVRQDIPADKPLTESECSEIALQSIKAFGWNTPVKIDPLRVKQEKHSANDPGVFEFVLRPEADGVLYDAFCAFTVSVDSKTGALTAFDARIPKQPTALLRGKISSTEAEGLAIRHIASHYRRSEFFISSAEPTQLVITRPPSSKDPSATLYARQVADNEGIFAFRVAFSTPSPQREDLRDAFVSWIDAYSGAIIHFTGGFAENFSAATPPDPKRYPTWPVNIQPVSVKGLRGRRASYGIIEPSTELLGSNTRSVTLYFKNQTIIARFDGFKNLLQVGARVGKPSGHLADALRAVTQ